MAEIEQSDGVGEYQKLINEGRFKIGPDKPIAFNEIGKRGIRRLDAYEKASGKAVYTRDIILPGMLYARVLSSPYAHARIKSMNTSKVAAFPGVRAVMRYDDAEIKDKMLNGSYMGPNWMVPEYVGWALKPVCAVLGSHAYYEGEPMGIIAAADSENIAEAALKLTDIDWEVMPFVLDQEEALKPDAPILRPGAKSNLLPHPANKKEVITIKKGDVAAGFQEADRIIEFDVNRNAYLWVGAEPPCVVVRWNGDRLEMWVHQHDPVYAKMLLSEWLNLPMNKITIHTPYQGGSFGERNNAGNVSENGMNILAALLARKTGRPVKLVYNRGQQFFGESSDVMAGHIKVGMKSDGTITAVQIKNIFAVYMGTTGIEHFIDNTKVPNLLCEALTVDVSKGPAWWCRCEHNQNAMCLTLIFDHVAAELGLDPTEVALKNDGCSGRDVTYLAEYKREHGFPDRDSLRECIAAGKKAIGWTEKWHKPGTKILPNGRYHGLAFTWSHGWDDSRGYGCAAIMIENDGTVSIIAQHSDVGVNPWTPLCQIVADELGLRVEDVNIKPFDLDHGFAMMSPDGSCNLVSNGNLIKIAARKARGMLLELAIKKFGDVTAEELDIKEGMLFVKADPTRRKTLREIVSRAVPMSPASMFEVQPPVIAWAWNYQGIWGQDRKSGRPRLCRQTHFIEVEVDPETGEIAITKVVNVNDVGKAISPETVEGQMYGGSYMGLSRGLTEEMVWDPQTGVLLNRNLLNYTYASMLDYGPIDTIVKETGMGHGPYGSCGIGESTPTVMPAIVGPAVYNAIGKWIDDYPITPDRILKALGKI